MTLLPAIVDKYMQMVLKTFQGHFLSINKYQKYYIVFHAVVFQIWFFHVWFLRYN